MVHGERPEVLLVDADEEDVGARTATQPALEDERGGDDWSRVGSIGFLLMTQCVDILTGHVSSVA